MQPPIIWHTYRPLMQLPAEATSWLLEQGSLTTRLIQASDGRFRVQRIRQLWCVPQASEAKALGLRPREKALIREVFLLCHDQPWVYARTVMPHTSLNGRLRFLRGLQNTSLGSLLFKDPQLQRSAFEISRLPLPHQHIPLHSGSPQVIYGRRSIFRLYRQPLLVAEFFLPACPLYHSDGRADG